MTSIDLPSIEEIKEIERKRQVAIDSLEIIDNHHVKCQKCQSLVPIKRLPRSHSSRIITIEKKIKKVERYHGNNNSSSTYKQLKEELATLLEEENKNDILRSLPLYSSRISNFKFLCSSCFEEAYMLANKKR